MRHSTIVILGASLAATSCGAVKNQMNYAIHGHQATPEEKAKADEESKRALAATEQDRKDGVTDMHKIVHFSGDQAAAFDATVRALVSSRLTVLTQDRASGLIQTDYRDSRDTSVGHSILVGAAAGAGVQNASAPERIMFAVFVDRDRISIDARPETCRNGCAPSTSMNGDETTILDALVEQIRIGLPVASPTMPSERSTQ